jgi:hypothetical protein
MVRIALTTRLATFLVVTLVATTPTPGLAQQTERKKGDGALDATVAVETIPGPARMEPAEVVPVHPLHRSFERPPKLTELPAAQDYRGKATLFFALKVDETGKVVQAEVVDPPLRGIVPAATEIATHWLLDPARKDGKAVRTWAAYSLDLVIELERPVFTSFSAVPINKSDAIPLVLWESVGEEGLLRFPREPDDVEPGVISIEDVDFLPGLKKTPWKFEPIRLKSRFSAILQVSPAGAVERVIPTGTSFEPFVLVWIRTLAARWKFTPALDGETPQRAYMNLDLVVEYEVTRAKESAKRLLKKNLKGSPAG